MTPPTARSAPNLPAIFGAIVALVAAGVVLFLELWTVVPAPNLATLVVATVIPEITPWAVAGCIVAGAIAQFAARGWARTVAFTGSALALGLALVPWCLLPATLATCEREMHLALDPGYPAIRSGPSDRTAPYRLATALSGFAPPAGSRLLTDRPVRTGGGVRLGLDVYAPQRRGPHPTVIVVYGGAWIFGKRSDVAQIARVLASLGYTAIVVDYRHAPAATFPTQLDDVHAAIATIASHAGSWDVDPQRVAIFGFSAGAQLALLAAYTPEPVKIRAVVAYYAPTDLVAGYRIPPRPDPLDVRRILLAYLGGSLADRADLYREASPVTHVRPGLPPTLLIGGGRDELVRLAFAHELRDALRRSNDRVAALDLPWSNHAFDGVANGTGGQIARFYTERFLAATLAGPRTSPHPGISR